MEEGVTITAGLVVGVIAACVWIFGNQALPRLVALSVLTTSVGIASTRVGDWLNSAVEKANDLIGKGLGNLFDRPDITTPGTALWAIGALVLALFVGFRFAQQKIDYWALAATMLLPYAVATIPGALGDFGHSALETIASVIAWPLKLLFGW